MDFLDEIWTTITKNKSRSLLTAFGVFWGILMLVILLGLGGAMQNGIFAGLSGFNANSCILSTNLTSKPYKGLQKGRAWNFENRDIDILYRQVKGIDAVVPFTFGRSSDNNVSRGEHHGTYGISGVVPEFKDVLAFGLAQGRFLNNIDVAEKRKVCVIGCDVYKDLFPEGGNAIGARLRVDNIYCTVIGVMKKCETDININGRPDEAVLLPFTTIQQTYHYGDQFEVFMATAKDGYLMGDVMKEIEATVKQLHMVAPDDSKALWTVDFEEDFRGIGYLKLGINLLIWIIGMGTLISGAIGVSNIMLVTVRERTKEIGIRRALGASPWVIVRQILAESVLLTSLAGVLGIMLGVGVLRIVEIAVANSDGVIKEPQISFGLALGALFVIIVCGLLAGLLPALRALSIKPIEALGEE